MRVPSMNWLRSRLGQLRHFNSAEVAARDSFQALLTMFNDQANGVNEFGAIGQLSRSLIKTEAHDRLVEFLGVDPACAALIHDRYLPKHPDRIELLGYPAKSLGRCYGELLQQPGLYPDLYSDIAVVDDGSYVEARLSQTHDLWHLITGFGTSDLDEIGLQAFQLAQFPYPFAAMLIANALVSVTLLAPEQLPELLTSIDRGQRLGKSCSSLFAQRWEEGWEVSLEEWRSQLGIPVR
jgi:ubiquinone biosynthesis protein COQ4